LTAEGEEQGLLNSHMVTYDRTSEIFDHEDMKEAEKKRYRPAMEDSDMEGQSRA